MGLDFEFDHKNVLFARIDRKRKLHATVVLKAMGYSTADLLKIFYHHETLKLSKDGTVKRELELDLLNGTRSNRDVLNPADGKAIVKKGKKFL